MKQSRLPKPGPRLTALVSERRIGTMLQRARRASSREVSRILRKALRLRGLPPEEAAVLLHQDRHPRRVAEILSAAGRVKAAIYGRRLVFFAPLYVSNVCRNNCRYCAFRRDNRDLRRHTLSPAEIARQVEVLQEQGHKRLLLVAGESQRFENILQALRIIYATRKGRGEIRRVNVNIAPPSLSEFRRLRAEGIGTYQCFQETYHRGTYRRMHPDGPKADYAWRLTVMDRALRAKVDDVSLGVLLGLYDYRFDVTAMLVHARYLEECYGVGPHALSVPRLRVAHGTPLAEENALAGNPYKLTDRQFKLVVASLRLALPYAGLILTTRETPAMRRELARAGVSQISAGSHTEVGGYARTRNKRQGQFEIEDHRPLDEVVRDAMRGGHLPSFCTACYRCGRTGRTIMRLIKPGKIKNFCGPNALLTLQEYLLDYGTDATRRRGFDLIAAQVPRLPASVRKPTRQRLARIRAGERDLYF